MFSEAEVWQAGVALLVVLWLGSRLSDPTSPLRALGKRIAALAFMCHLIYGLAVVEPAGADGWMSAVIAAAIVAGFVLGMAWIVLPVASSIYQGTIGTALQRARFWSRAHREAAEARQRRREAAESQRRAQETYERSAPERERQSRIEEQRRNVLADHQRRKERSRAACELVYDLHAPEIQERFPRDRLVQFIETYMSDSQSVEEVEQRGNQLGAIIEQHRKCVKPEKRPRTIQDLAEWYLHEKETIATLPLDEELKQEHIAALDMRYAELTQEVLQNLEP